MRESVKRFATLMESKLESLDEEKGEEGWLGDTSSISSLFELLRLDVIEAQLHKEDCDPVELCKECIDIANFAMMIVDRIRDRVKK